MEDALQTKAHRKRASGPKAEKKRAKKPGAKDEGSKNPKAFTFKSAVRAARVGRRKLDIAAKRQRVPQIDRTPVEPPPVCVAIVGPPKVGKTTLIRDLVKNFTRQTLTESKGPVTVVSGQWWLPDCCGSVLSLSAGKKRRLTLVECGNDLNVMLDVAKVADLVLLLVDASFGFEMETFEFLNILQVYATELYLVAH